MHSTPDKPSGESQNFKETPSKLKSNRLKTGKVNKDIESILKSRNSETRINPNKDLYNMIPRTKSSKGKKMLKMKTLKINS